jgi:hypothetical protein
MIRGEFPAISLRVRIGIAVEQLLVRLWGRMVPRVLLPAVDFRYESRDD